MVRPTEEIPVLEGELLWFDNNSKRKSKWLSRYARLYPTSLVLYSKRSNKTAEKTIGLSGATFIESATGSKNEKNYDTSKEASQQYVFWVFNLEEPHYFACKDREELDLWLHVCEDTIREQQEIELAAEQALQEYEAVKQAVRRRWRVLFAYLFAARMFMKMLMEQKTDRRLQYSSASLIQKTYRGFIARRYYLKQLQEIRCEEERKARAEAEYIYYLKQLQEKKEDQEKRIEKIK